MPPYPDPIPCIFLKKVHEYEAVYTYFFEPTKPVTFTAGQYAHVRLLSLPETTRRVRELSFASSPNDAQIQFGIDNKSGSDYQEALLALSPGDVIEIFKIKSHMTWPQTAGACVMIGGGIGITPFRSMLRDRKQNNLPCTTTVLHVANDVFLYVDELRELATEYKTTNRAGLEEALNTITSAQPEAHYYVAGSLGFVDAVTIELMQRGVTHVETDVFKGLPD